MDGPTDFVGELEEPDGRLEGPSLTEGDLEGMVLPDGDITSNAGLDGGANPGGLDFVGAGEGRIMCDGAKEWIVGREDRPALIDGDTEWMVFLDGEDESPNAVGTSEGRKLALGGGLGFTLGRERRDGALDLLVVAEEGLALIDEDSEGLVLPDGEDESTSLVGTSEGRELALGGALGFTLGRALSDGATDFLVGVDDGPAVIDRDSEGVGLPDGDDESTNLVGTSEGWTLALGGALDITLGRTLCDGASELLVGVEDGPTLVDGEFDGAALPDGEESLNFVGTNEGRKVALGDAVADGSTFTALVDGLSLVDGESEGIIVFEGTDGGPLSAGEGVVLWAGIGAAEDWTGDKVGTPLASGDDVGDATTIGPSGVFPGV